MNNNNNSNNNETAGGIDERGFINSLNRQGFTPVKSGSEIIANLIDACASTGIFEVHYPDYIKLVDDGNGMTKEGLKNMCNIFKENHSSQKSMGVSGMGGSAAAFQLSKYNNSSNPRPVTYFTKHLNDKYLKVYVPWDKIFHEGKYSNQSQISKMTEDEIELFDADRLMHQLNSTGTTIMFPYSEEFNNLLKEQFKPKKEGNNLKEAWSAVFGKTNTNIKYIKYQKNNIIETFILNKYDYFKGSDYDFYCGKFCTEIYHFIDDGRSRFVCKDPTDNNKYLEVVKSGPGFSESPTQININNSFIKNANIITFTSGMRIDDKIFNVSNPQEINACYIVNNYDNDFMFTKADNQKFCSEIPVYRNNQRIAGYTLDGYSLSSARANGESMAKIVYHRASLEYSPYSTQNNQIDLIHGTQQNKNQNQNDPPKNYIRLVKNLKDWHFKQINNYFKEIIAKKNTKTNNKRPKLKIEFEEENFITTNVQEIVEENQAIAVEENIQEIETIAVEENIQEIDTIAVEENIQEIETIDIQEIETIAVEENVEEIETVAIPEIETVAIEEIETIAVEENVEEIETVAIPEIETVAIEEIETVAIEENVEEIETVAIPEIETIAVEDIDDSKLWLMHAANYIKSIADNPNYSQTNGKEIYAKIISLLNN